MNIRSLAPFGAEVIGIDCACPLIDHAALAQQNAQRAGGGVSWPVL